MVVYGILFGDISVIVPNAAMVDYGILFGGISVIVPNAAMATMRFYLVVYQL